MESITLIIKDMDCAEEVGILKKALLPLVGAESRLVFNVLARKLMVDLTGLPVGHDQVIAAVAKTGMKAETEALPQRACCGGVCPPPRIPFGRATAGGSSARRAARSGRWGLPWSPSSAARCWRF